MTEVDEKQESYWPSYYYWSCGVFVYCHWFDGGPHYLGGGLNLGQTYKSLSHISKKTKAKNILQGTSLFWVYFLASVVKFKVQVQVCVGRVTSDKGQWQPPNKGHPFSIAVVHFWPPWKGQSLNGGQIATENHCHCLLQTAAKGLNQTFGRLWMII